MAPPSLVFTVKRQEAVLVVPAKPTPRELKPLSDIDDQRGLRFHMASVHFYRRDPSMIRRGVDPVKTLRDALAKALVFYYPLAGRLTEQPDGKLVVECNEEGVLFVEADADVRLEQFGDEVRQPIPCVDQLIYGDRYSGMVGCPLVLIQVTRLKCGGFVFACRMNHTMVDASGKNQFISAVAEIARGSDTPSVTPVWARELLTARNPPRITHYHPEYDHHLINNSVQVAPFTDDDMVHRSFFFGPREVSILKNHLPPDLRTSSSRFEVLAACTWRCRSLALYSDQPSLVAGLHFIVNARGKNGPPLPVGYYGNAFAFAVARAKVGEMGSKPLSYVVELVKKARASITDGYMQSVSDLMVLRGRPTFAVDSTYCLVSDVTSSGFDGLDLGWGRPVYSGPARTVIGTGIFASFYTRSKNVMGEEGTLVPISLPKEAMNKFAKEIERMLREPSATEMSYVSRLRPKL